MHNPVIKDVGKGRPREQASGSYCVRCEIQGVHMYIYIGENCSV